jgi:hypothetical protein
MKTLTCVLSFLLALGLSARSSAQNQAINCTRGQAEPIVKKSVFPNTDFQLQADNRTAIEAVDLKNGDKLIIRNWGCEYYCLTFNFETSRFQKDTANLGFWFKASSKLMTEVLKGIDAPADLKRGIAALNDYIGNDKPNNYRNLEKGHRIYFGLREPREFVTVDGIQKLSEKKFSVKLTFTVPL